MKNVKKRALIPVAAAGVMVAAAIVCSKRGGPRELMYERMRGCMASMPDDVPPRVMFDNLQASRANTEEILELVRAGAAHPAEPAIP